MPIYLLTMPCTLVGAILASINLLAGKIASAKADVGNLIVVFQSGAYGLSASPVAFLSHLPPAEMLV